jgi:hypothetical protein
MAGAFNEASIDRLAAAHGGIFTVAQARQLGWTQSAVWVAARAARLIRLRQGAYTSPRIWEAATTMRRERLVLLAHQRLDPNLIGWGLSAAAALGLPLPDVPLTTLGSAGTSPPLALISPE